jgi:hypothetical protein
MNWRSNIITSALSDVIIGDPIVSVTSRILEIMLYARRGPATMFSSPQVNSVLQSCDSQTE